MKDRAILVVDDDPFICKVITEFLEAASHRPTAVGDSQKAVELFAAHSFDLVITDYNMPVMTGVELARRMRVLKPSIPICLVTGAADEIHSSELEVFDGVLEKPFEQPELAALVAAALPSRDREPPYASRPLRYAVDWRVDYIPLAAAPLMRRALVPRRATLRNLSEHGLAFVADPTAPTDRFCAFLIYPPESRAPSLMVAEVRWAKDDAGKKLSGTRSLFWGSEREKTVVIEQAM